MSSNNAEDPPVATSKAANESDIAKATATFNKKLDLEQSLLARIEALRNRIQKIMEDAKKNEPKEGEEKGEEKEEKKAKPQPPTPLPEPGTPDKQVLPLLFGIAFILIKIMNQENLNRQSIYNMNNYFEYITMMIQVYQKLCNTAATKGYPLKTALLINSLKSFYAYFFMAVSDKIQKLITSPKFEGTDWISTLSPEEDKKFASMEFMNVIDDLFKDIHPAFEYMVEDYQVTDPLTIESMKGAMDELKEGNSKKEEQKGGAAPKAASSAASNSASSSAISEDDATEEKKGPVIFTKSPVPDEGCELGKPCQRKIDELKSSADAQTDQLNQVLEKGLTTVSMEAITQTVSDLALTAKDIHISMVERLQPPAEGSPEEIGKILKELKEIKTALLNRIPVWIKSFDAASKIQSDKLNPTQLADVKRMGTTGMEMLNRIETLIKAESVFDKLLVKTETLSNQKGLKPDIIPIPKFKNLLTSMKKLLELLQKPAADNTTQVELHTIEKQLIVAIDEINKALPTILNIPPPTPTAEEKVAATSPPPEGPNPESPPGPSPGSLVAQRGLPPLPGSPEFKNMEFKDAIYKTYSDLDTQIGDIIGGAEFTRDVQQRMGAEVISKFKSIEGDVTTIVKNIKTSGITTDNKASLDDLAASIKKFITTFQSNKMTKSNRAIIVKEADTVSQKIENIRKIPQLIPTVGGARTLRRSKRKTTKTKKRLRRA
jgi:hypothetical protein